MVSSESSSFGNEFLDFLLEHYEAREVRGVSSRLRWQALTPGMQGHEHILQWLHCLHVASLADGATRKRAYDSALLDAAHKMLEKLSGAFALFVCCASRLTLLLSQRATGRFPSC